MRIPLRCWAAFDDKDDILVCCMRQFVTAAPQQESLYAVGVSATILQLLRLPNGSIKVFIEGKSRQHIKNILYDKDQLFAATEQFIDFIADEHEAEALRRLVVESFKEYCEIYGIDIASDVVAKMVCPDDPGMVCDMVVSYTTLKTEKKQEILEDNHIESRIEKVYGFLQTEIDIARIQASMREQARQKAAAGKKARSSSRCSLNTSLWRALRTKYPPWRSSLKIRICLHMPGRRYFKCSNVCV